MKKTSRKVLSILLCLLLLLPMASAVVPAAGAEGEEAVVAEGGDVTVAGVRYDYVYVKFVPETDARYVGYVTNGAQAYVYLYDENHNWSSNDFNSMGLCITYYLTAGTTYYFGVYCQAASEDVTLAVKAAADYEADVLAANAITLSPGEPQALQLAPGAAQWYQATTPAYDAYMFYLTGGDDRAQITAFGSGLYQYYSYSGVSNSYNLGWVEQGRTYYFLVRNETASAFEKQVIFDTRAQYAATEINPNAAALTAGEAAATPMANGQSRYFTFTPDVTARYTFLLENAGDITMYLYNETMNDMNSAYNGEALRSDSTLTAGSTYYLLVRSYVDAPDAVLQVMLSSDYAAQYIAADATELTVGTTSDVTIDTTRRYYKYVVPETGSYTVAVNNSQTASVSASQYDDEMVNYNGNSGKNILLDIYATAGKTYYLSLNTYNGETAAVQVTVAKTADYLAEQATEIQQNVAVDGTLANGARAFFKFVPATTQEYVISTGTANYLDGRVFDAASGGYTSSFGSTDSVNRTRMTAGRTYYLTLYNYNMAMDYSLKVQSAADYYDEIATPLTLNEQTEVPAANAGSYARFTPDEAGAYVFLIERESSMYAGLCDSNFIEKAYADGSGSLLLNGTLQAGETYYLTLSNHGYTEPFNVTVKKLADYLRTEAQTLVLDEEMTIETSADCFFRFTPAETGNYTIASAGYGDQRVVLLDASLQEIARNEDISAFDGNFKLEYKLTAGETYYYRVSSSNFGGSYTVMLSRTCDHGDTTDYPAVEMTCTVDGYTAGVYCNICGEWLSGHVKTRATHKDADKDRVCDVCGQPAILKSYSCNEAGTVTAAFYLSGDLLITGEGAMETAPWLQDETEDEFFLYTLLYTVTNIEIAEGVTAVCQNAFSSMENLRTVSIPSTVGEVGQGAFRDSYITDLTILNDTLPINNQFSLPGYYVRTGTFPFTTYDSYFKYRTALMSAEYLGYAGGIYGDYLDELLEAEVQMMIEEGMTEEAARAYVEQMIDEALRMVVFELNAQFGTNAATMAELRDQLLAKVNAALGTAYTSYTDVVTVTLETDDEGYPNPQVAWTDGFNADMEAVFGISVDGLSQTDFSVSLFALGKAPGSYTPFQDVTIHANCGSTAQTAAVASRVKFDSLKHDYAETELTPATCTEDGLMQYQCKYCDDSYTAPITKTGHSFTNYAFNNDATCTADGTETAVCDNGCGATDTRTAEGSKLSHSFTHYVADGNATCDADGTKTAVCDNGCGATDTVADPGSKLGHDYTSTVTTPATCGKDGVRTYTCKHDPSHTYTEKINATGNHTWGDWTTTKQPTEKETGVKTRTCSVCGQSQTESIPKLNPQPQTNPNVCHWCGKVHSNNFFQKIVAFFHNIFAKIFGNRH